jgi:hypothetical protein
MNFRYECRENTWPFGGDETKSAVNIHYAGTNPIPDGLVRKRTIEILDGAIINQTSMVIFFRERYTTFLGTDDSDFTAYGLMQLQKVPATLDGKCGEEGAAEDCVDDYSGSDQKYVDGAGERIDPDTDASMLKLQCSSSLMADLETLAEGPVYDQANNQPVVNVARLNRAALFLVGGTTGAVGGQAVGREKIHYICHDTGTIDGCPTEAVARQDNLDPDGDDIEREPCPVNLGSGIDYFQTMDGVNGPSRRDICSLNCNRDGTCLEFLKPDPVAGEIRSRFSSTYDVKFNVAYTCDELTVRQGNEDVQIARGVCDESRRDMRQEKSFFAPLDANGPTILPLRSEINSAFRYRTRFKNRDGVGLAFAPQICVPGSDAICYCYDPGQIEAIRDRVDCLVSLYLAHKEDLGDGAAGERTIVEDYLLENYGVIDKYDPI